jgi:four helix bundle protein
MASIKRFQELECWRKAQEFCWLVHKVASETGLAKDYSLRYQIERSVRSMLDNIAEGFDRDGNKGFMQFLYLSTSSGSKSMSPLYRILDCEYIDQQKFDKLYTRYHKTQAMIKGLINYLSKSEFRAKNLAHFLALNTKLTNTERLCLNQLYLP